jgi:hypothetical protein
MLRLAAKWGMGFPSEILEYRLPDAEGAKVSQRTQKIQIYILLRLLRNLCDLCVQRLFDFRL